MSFFFLSDILSNRISSRIRLVLGSAKFVPPPFVMGNRAIHYTCVYHYQNMVRDRCSCNSLHTICFLFNYPQETKPIHPFCLISLNSGCVFYLNYFQNGLCLLFELFPKCNQDFTVLSLPCCCIIKISKLGDHLIDAVLVKMTTEAKGVVLY